MRRFFSLLAVAAIVVALPLSHAFVGGGDAWAKKVAKKKHIPVEICHVDGQGRGRVITVDSNSVEAHFDHGDCYPEEALVFEDGECWCDGDSAG